MTQAAKKSRRAVLEEFLTTHPKDAFARYGLAMECATQGDSAAAIENFEALLAENPTYVNAAPPSYAARSNPRTTKRLTLRPSQPGHPGRGGLWLNGGPARPIFGVPPHADARTNG